MTLLGVLLIIAGVALELLGLWRLHVVILVKSEQIVSAEGINYLIHGLRGIGFVVAGGATSLLGGACLIVAAVRRLQRLEASREVVAVRDDEPARAPAMGLGRRARLDED
jgi:hypothetical protein